MTRDLLPYLAEPGTDVGLRDVVPALQVPSAHARRGRNRMHDRSAAAYCLQLEVIGETPVRQSGDP
jgi:hypothetical protein